MDRHLDEKLNSIKMDLLQMATMVEDAILQSIDALKNHDKNMAKEVILKDSEIDEMEIKIEEAIIDLFALYQPMAIDLRFLATGMHINTELERIADLTVNISQRVFEMAESPILKPLKDIPYLAEQAKSMVRRAIDSFVKKDQDLAIEVIFSDKESNRLRSEIINELVNDFIVKNPQTASVALSLVLMTRDLERICDHAAAIAEDVIYMIDAKVVRHHRDQLSK